MTIEDYNKWKKENDKKFIVINCSTCIDGQSERNQIVYGSDVGDEYHTMSELYNHRYALFYALTKIYDNYITPIGSIIQCWKSKLHDDGTMFDDSFIVGMTIKHTDWNGIIKREYITYHYPLSWWDKFKIMELQKAPEWDGHTSDDVIERLMSL